MTAPATGQTRVGLHLRLGLRLQTGLHSIPLERVDHLAGYATLTGQADDYFLGWLTFHGREVPVFDLNRVVCEAPTPEQFGSRIILVRTAGGADGRQIGLLAGGVTDTLSASSPGSIADAAAAEEAQALDLDMYLPMLAMLIPPAPEASA